MINVNLKKASRPYLWMFLAMITGVLGIASGVNAQDLDQFDRYKYIIVETLMYPNNEVDKYQMSAIARQEFMNRGYAVVPENPDSWPDSLTANPCLALTGKITSRNPKMGKLKVTLKLINCRQEVIYDYTAGGVGDEITEAYQEGIKACFVKMRKHKYAFDESRALGASEQIEAKDIPLQHLFGKYVVKTPDGKMELTIKLEEGGDAVVGIVESSKKKGWSESEVLFTVAPSSIDGVYSVEWRNDDKETTYQALGSQDFESGNFTLEFKNPQDPRPALTLRPR